ncbi:hypothetical protein PQQ88_10700 [Paraburkholderia caledonica]|uniref:hypothetical protein n=1 Tax=Paraburkholderia caledonica TaxID=134536 RepID=UPI0038BE07C0
MHSDVGRSSEMSLRPAKRESNVRTWIWQSLLVTLVLAAGIYWRFSPWLPKVFYGDDLYNIVATLKDHVFVGTWQSALTSEFYEKYRPVFHLAWFALAQIFHTDLRGFLAFDFFLQLASAVVFFSIAMQLSHRNRVVSLVLAFTFATSRFALYQATQATGMVEALALLFFLLAVTVLLKSLTQPERGGLQWVIVGLYFLCIHSHERYIAVAPWLATAMAMTGFRRSGGFVNRFGGAIAILAIPLLNILIKTTLLHSAFFVGTGATHLDINIARIVDLSEQAVFSVFGFNYGPQHLVGHSIVFGDNEPGDELSRAIATIATVAVAVAVLWSVVVGRKQHAPRQSYLLFAIALVVLLLAPPVLTIRVEQRWMYAPFAVLLAILAWSTRLDGRKVWVPVIASLVACASLLAVDTRLSAFFPRIYLSYAATASEIAKRDLVDAHAAPVGGDLLLQISADNCRWTFIEGRFFELYDGKPRNLTCYTDSKELPALRQQHPSARAFIYTPGVSFTPAPGNK